MHLKACGQECFCSHQETFGLGKCGRGSIVWGGKKASFLTSFRMEQQFQMITLDIVLDDLPEGLSVVEGLCVPVGIVGITCGDF